MASYIRYVSIATIGEPSEVMRIRMQIRIRLINLTRIRILIFIDEEGQPGTRVSLYFNLGAIVLV
jgi:hypothetical protein